MKFKFIAVFSKEDERIFDDLKKLVNKIFNAADEIARIQLGTYGVMTTKVRVAAIKEQIVIIYSSSDEGKDSIEIELKKIISDIEKACKNILGKYKY